MIKKKPAPKPGLCLLMDSKSDPVARGLVENPPEERNLQIRIVDGQMDEIMTHEIFQVVTEDRSQPVRLGRIILRRGMLIVLEPLRTLSDEVRKNLRMPVDFESFAYPQPGGRVPVVAYDLSCGGISFFAGHDYDFAPEEQFEMVIPITAPAPLILNCRILRGAPADNGKTLYAAKFVDMIIDEEHRVREAVFNVQLKRHR